jgi:hypothetical protein
MFSTLTRGKRKFAALAVGLVLVPSSAYAAWSLSAHGQGNAQIGSLQQPVVSAGSPPVGQQLLPGGVGSATFRIDSSNSVPLEVYATAVGDGTGTSSNEEDCDPHLLTAVATQLATPITVQPGTSTITIPGAVRLSPSAPTTCQGRTITTDVDLKFRTVG